MVFFKNKMLNLSIIGGIYLSLSWMLMVMLGITPDKVPGGALAWTGVEIVRFWIFVMLAKQLKLM